MRKYLLNTKFQISACILALAALFTWLSFLTPHWTEVSFIDSQMRTWKTDSPMVPGRENQEDSIFWITLQNAPQWLTTDHLNLRVRGCLKSLSIDGHDISLGETPCNNVRGIELPSEVSSYLKAPHTWYIAGSNNGKSFGVFFEKDWKDIKVMGALILLTLFLGTLTYLSLPSLTSAERLFTAGLVMLTFAIRYYFVFVVSPPEINISTDMLAYYRRAQDFSTGNYSWGQIFQPVGFTLWSLLTRATGGWELFKWAQVFLSLGTAILIFSIGLRHLGKIAAFIALTLAAIHLPLVSFASLHLAENIYAFLLTLSLAWTLNLKTSSRLWRYGILGFLLTLAFYMKGTHALFLPLFGIWVLWKERDNLRQAFKKNVAFAVGCMILITPHLIWTKHTLGKAAWGPKAGALNFVEGKCPWKDNADSRGERWMSPLFVFTKETAAKKWPRPFSDDAFFWKEGWKCVEENPYVLFESFRSIYYLAAGNPLWPPNSTPIKPYLQSWEPLLLMFLLPLAFLGLLIRRSDSRQFYEITLMMVLSLFFTVWFFKSENRFRVPFDGIMILWAAWALEMIFVFCGTKVALYLIRDWQMRRSAS